MMESRGLPVIGKRYTVPSPLVDALCPALATQPREDVRQTRLPWYTPYKGLSKGQSPPR